MRPSPGDTDSSGASVYPHGSLFHGEMTGGDRVWPAVRDAPIRCRPPVFWYVYVDAIGYLHLHLTFTVTFIGENIAFACALNEEY